jgi:hypothetical protein
MTRDLKTKKLDSTFQFSDDFDERMLDIIEKKEFDSEDDSEDRPGTGPDSHDSDLDDVPSLDPEDLADEPVPKLEGRSEAGEDAEPAPPEKKRLPRGFARKKAFWIGSSALSALLILTTIIYALFSGGGVVVDPGVSMIRLPITVPHNQQAATFFIYVDSGQRKDIFKLAVEFDYSGVGGLPALKEKEVIFRDAVYQFFTSHRPPESSYKYWEQIVQKDLPPHLKTLFPDSRIQSIRLASFGRM